MWENTFLWLSADNGGDNPVGLASNYPLLGRKCLSWEGGTRTFAFLSGGLIPAAKRGTVNARFKGKQFTTRPVIDMHGKGQVGSFLKQRENVVDNL